jgi:hypothetical protein
MRVFEIGLEGEVMRGHQKRSAEEEIACLRHEAIAVLGSKLFIEWANKEETSEECLVTAKECFDMAAIYVDMCQTEHNELHKQFNE